MSNELKNSYVIKTWDFSLDFMDKPRFKIARKLGKPQIYFIIWQWQ